MELITNASKKDNMDIGIRTDCTFLLKAKCTRRFLMEQNTKLAMTM